MRYVSVLFSCLLCASAHGAAPPSAAQTGATINVVVNITSNVHPFSPLIFGVAFGDAARNAQMGYTVDRWGGNSTSRYNWQGPAHNAGNDYFYLGYGSDQTDSADGFIGNALNSNIQPLLAVPTIGWVEKFDSSNPTQVVSGFSQAKYGPQTSDECRFYGANPPDWCHADAGNGVCNANSNKTGHCVGGKIAGNDPTDTSIAVTSADTSAWVTHLKSTFGAASNGGVKIYSLDNEVMLWNSTHRDVHPSPATYDEIWNKAVDYAGAIKKQDPNALVTGPVTWGYCDLFGSAADDCLDGTDRQAHGGMPFVAWYLQQVCAHPLAGGAHVVDYLDLHYYPQDPNGASGSIYSNDDDAQTIGRRLRSLKELYDPTWFSESWIGGLDGLPPNDGDPLHYPIPDLIPRARAWIDQYCPGTKLAITEYAWDQDNTNDGAVAQAEALAIFAREGVDLATRWTAPAANTKAESGFKIFLNYDGAGARVEGDSVEATTDSIDQVGAYAFHGDGNTMVLLTNKDTVSHGVALTFNAPRNAAWTLYGFDSVNTQHMIGNGNLATNALTLNPLPPMSASLLVVPDNDEIFKNGFN